jgi:hypothetical protein
MLGWFRSWHGAPTDPKWLVIARRANVAPGEVSAVVWALLDHASQAEDRGSVEHFDFETYAAFAGFAEERVRSIYGALESKGVVVEGRFAKWEQRQPQREDSSAERVSRHRRRPDQDQGGRNSAAATVPLGDSCEATPGEVDPKDPTGPKDQPSDESTPLVRPEARELADEIAVIAGHDLRFVPPTWCGAAARIEMWLKQEWRPPLILESVRAQMARKRDGPPGSVRYFEKGIMSAHAQVGVPLPRIAIDERQGDVIHVVPRSRSAKQSGLAAIERLRERITAPKGAAEGGS